MQKIRRKQQFSIFLHNCNHYNYNPLQIALKASILNFSLQVL